MNHISETEILLYLNNQLPDESRKEIEKHISTCSDCRSELWEMAQFKKKMNAADPPEVSEEYLKKAEDLIYGKKEETVKKVFSRSKIILAAAVILIALFLGFILFQLNSGSVETERFRSYNEGLAVSPVLPEDETEIKDSTVEFKWHPVENAITYRLTLFNANGEELWDKQVQDTVQVLTNEVSLEPGNQYLWRIEAVFSDQRQITSGLQSFTYQPE